MMQTQLREGEENEKKKVGEAAEFPSDIDKRRVIILLVDVSSL
jgi:hypothetical protein